MDPCELAVLITAIAVFISKNVEDDDELGLLALVFTQLGDTLATIVAQRELIANKTQSVAEEIILANEIA